MSGRVSRTTALAGCGSTSAYDGTDFSGWARQPGLRTVQGTLEDALGRILRLTEVRLTVAGRTDAGVHARGQVAHVESPRRRLDDMPPSRLGRPRLADCSPKTCASTRVGSLPDGFDARFSAIWRRYAYRIVDDAGGCRSARPAARCLPWPRRLDVDAMNRRRALLLGEHDFAAYCERREGATTVRALRELDVTATVTWSRSVRADAFCHRWSGRSSARWSPSGRAARTSSGPTRCSPRRPRPGRDGLPARA